jgi:hypothetical protein
MTKDKALKAFKKNTLVDLENELTGTEEEPGWKEPRLDVRLDAASEESTADETYGQTVRTWRLRVTFSKSGWYPGTEQDALREILAVADEAEARVVIQNSGLELT